MMSLFNNLLFGSTYPFHSKKLKVSFSLKSLSSLALHINQLNSVIPPSIGNLTSLRTLYIYNNRLYSFIPEEIGYLKSLAKLVLCANHLTGLFLVQLVNSLVLTNTCENHLFSPIPESLRNVISLDRVRFNQNNLFGKVHEAFGYYLNATFLNLGRNKFYREILFN